MAVTLMYTHTHTHKVIKKTERNKNKASPYDSKGKQEQSFFACERKRNGKCEEHECEYDMEVDRIRKYGDAKMQECKDVGVNIAWCEYSTGAQWAPLQVRKERKGTTVLRNKR